MTSQGPIKTVAVIGAGQMGAGIAQVAAAAGLTAILFDKVPGAATKGVEGIKAQLTKLVEKQKVTSEQAQTTVSNLKVATNLSDLTSAQFVVEAIVENPEVKCALFKELDALMPKDAVLASNTSSISITKIAAATTRPEKVIGMHFMNPVPVMKLVEIIRGIQTSDATYQATATLSTVMKKTTVLGIDRAGFIVNRILCPMINEAIFLLEQGVGATDIDTAMKLGTNQPMGPLELADFVGLDTLLSILQILHRELGEDKYRPAPLLAKYVEAGWFGRKTKRGFYQYP